MRDTERKRQKDKCHLWNGTGEMRAVSEGAPDWLGVLRRKVDMVAHPTTTLDYVPCLFACVFEYA